MSTMNAPLAKPLRSQLENTVKAARDVAEKAAQAALAQLAVSESRAPDYLGDDHKALRRRLRAHGRALGDAKARDDSQDIQHLVWEVAYEHWHRMLFARFLAENGLLMWEPGAPVSLDDCRDMVDSHPDLAMGAKTHWELAGKLAARMLPQVFKPHSPVFELTFAPEHQRELERLLGALPTEVFKASDSLGWVYQYWQAKRKDEVNASEVKIGADELPAVTQLFTEPYMVDFLLHNSLGAWWVTRHPGKICPVPLTYLRQLPDGTPAAGKFEGWPDRLEDFKLLDPCCGSGHFLVAAFLLLVPMRMAAEGLSAMDAVDAVLADNLHGLELDARCVEIAVFALALAAWRFPDENGDPLGVRADMPAPQVACCGLKVAAKPEDWMALVPDDAPNAVYLRQELRLLHASFAQAPLLGSLLDPARSLKNDLATSSFDTLRELLERALATERPMTLSGQASELQDDTWDLALTARGLLDAAQLLERRYHLIATNVPFLGQKKQSEGLLDFSKKIFAGAHHDLATVMILRSLELTCGSGVIAVVSPGEWAYLKTYLTFRRQLLDCSSVNLLVLLGYGAFATPLRVSPVLSFIVNGHSGDIGIIRADASGTIDDKIEAIRTKEIQTISKADVMLSYDACLINSGSASGEPLAKYAKSISGILTSDNGWFIRKFWESKFIGDSFSFIQTANDSGNFFGGLSDVVLYEQGAGALAGLAQKMKGKNHAVQNWRRGQDVWGKKGVALNKMGELSAGFYLGEIYDDNVATLVPQDENQLPAIWCYCESGELQKAVRDIDIKMVVTNATFAKVPFDLGHWQRVAAERYPDGLPKPYSDDPTQWLFHGHPQPATDPLQVAVARLAGYCWPAETDASMELADEARAWIARCERLTEHTDDDGIVCLPSVRGEPPAHERLLKLLIAAWETVQPGSWKPAVLDKLLADADCAGKGLDVWLRDKFFEQHAKRFQHRPFIWHVWDGQKDGFSALVNYHQLDAKNLERLIHTYLGDWIRQQEAGVRDGIDGAKVRLAAAQDLKRRLELIQEGEAPYDIFVRWRPLAEQPIGWNPDLNDGVRLNIRPFVTAEVLRINKKPKLNIKWDKDRGKDVESAPWFPVFKGERINDHHLTLAEKLAARKE